MKILIKSSPENVISFAVKETDTIGSIKQQIHSKQGFPLDEQYLLFGGMDLEDDSTLEYYNIRDGDCLYLFILSNKTMEIKIKFSSMETISLTFQISHTIKYIKKYIQYKRGIPLTQQCLMFEGTNLDNDYTLEEYKIPDGATFDFIRLSDEHMSINIKSLDKKTIPLDVKSTDTIESVKQQIKDKKGILPSEQCLMFIGKALEDCYTLQDYNIRSGDDLYICSFFSEP